MEYVTRADTPEACVFCACGQHEPTAAEGVLARGKHCFVILNAFPYNSGHMMVVPYEHLDDFGCLPPETLQEMMVLAQVGLTVLREEFQCEGANVGMNIGKVAGAGIKDHLHLHIVPRWAGDTNFMTSLDATRVVPQALEDTWAQLAPTFARKLAEAGLS